MCGGHSRTPVSPDHVGAVTLAFSPSQSFPATWVYLIFFVLLFLLSAWVGPSDLGIKKEEGLQGREGAGGTRCHQAGVTGQS